MSVWLNIIHTIAFNCLRAVPVWKTRWTGRNIYFWHHTTTYFDLLTYCPLCKRIWDPETTSKFKKVWPLLHLSGHQTLFIFLRSRTTSSHACRRHLNTSLICPHIRMVILIISTSVLTSLPYVTNYDSTYLQHFAVKMHSWISFRFWVEICNMAPDAHACKEIFWKKKHDLLKRSWPAPNGPITSHVLFEVWFLPAVYFRHVQECHFFNSVGNFCNFSGFVWRVHPV